MSALTFSCLFTKQKLKKRKTWSDGVLHIKTICPPPPGSGPGPNVNVSSAHCVLHNCDDRSRISLQTVLDSRSLQAGEIRNLLNSRDSEFELEFENYIVQIDLTSSGQPEKGTVPIPVLHVGSKRPLQNDSDDAAVTNASHQDSSSHQQLQVTGGRPGLPKLPKFKPPSQITKPVSAATVTEATKPSKSSCIPSSSRLGQSKRYNVASDELDDIWDKEEIRSQSSSLRVTSMSQVSGGPALPLPSQYQQQFRNDPAGSHPPNHIMQMNCPRDPSSTLLPNPQLSSNKAGYRPNLISAGSGGNSLRLPDDGISKLQNANDEEDAEDDIWGSDLVDASSLSSNVALTRLPLSYTSRPATITKTGEGSFTRRPINTMSTYTAAYGSKQTQSIRVDQQVTSSRSRSHTDNTFKTTELENEESAPFWQHSGNGPSMAGMMSTFQGSNRYPLYNQGLHSATNSSIRNVDNGSLASQADGTTADLSGHRSAVGAWMAPVPAATTSSSAISYLRDNDPLPYNGSSPGDPESLSHEDASKSVPALTSTSFGYTLLHAEGVDDRSCQHQQLPAPIASDPDCDDIWGFG